MANTPLEGDSTSGTTPGVKGVNTATSGNGHGVFGTSANWEGVHGDTNSATAAGVAGIQLNPAGTGAGVFGGNDGKGHGVFGTSANWEGVHGETNSTTAAGVAGIQLNPAGTGAGVYGESRGKGPAGFFKGDVQVTGDVILTNQDCAEDFDIGFCTNVEPGTVMALDEQGLLQESRQAYDKKVAGVISGAGEFKPGLILGRSKMHSIDHRVPVALIGKVYCKVDAQFSEIHVGDLLTTSSTPGHAMKADDPLKGFGAVIGKALQSVSLGKRGLIPILVALQ
jgi:hypothetical protein